MQVRQQSGVVYLLGLVKVKATDSLVALCNFSWICVCAEKGGGADRPGLLFGNICVTVGYRRSAPDII